MCFTHFPTNKANIKDRGAALLPVLLPSPRSVVALALPSEAASLAAAVVSLVAVPPAATSVVVPTTLLATARLRP